MSYDKNEGYSQAQITRMLFEYMVGGQKAAYVCAEILKMAPDKIGKSQTAYTKLRPIYKSYGFEKRYNAGLAFRNISWEKLSRYVEKYWNVRATEQDLLNFFPEIAEDLRVGKSIDNNSGSWGSSSKEQSYRNDDYGPVRQTNDYQHSTVNTQRTTDNISERSMNYYKDRTKNQNCNSDYSARDKSNKKESTKETEIIFSVIVVFIIAFAIWKSGIVTSIGNGITNLFGTVLWILELVLFYGGILLFIAAIFKKRVKQMWMFCVGLSLCGLCAGSVIEGEWITAAICGIIGGVLISSKRY